MGQLSPRTVALLKSGARRLGLDVRRYRPFWSEDARREKFLCGRAVDLVIDVGANRGQYGEKLRAAGFSGRIISFEPTRGPFELLKSLCTNDGRWECCQLALGSESRTEEMYVSSNAYSSSLLPMLPRHELVAPESRVISKEVVEVRRLDELSEKFSLPDHVPFLKIDTQGSELDILEGATDCLSLMAGLELELSFVPLYEGQPLFKDLTDYLADRGFDLVGIEPGITDPQSGALLQCDGIFARR